MRHHGESSPPAATPAANTPKDSDSRTLKRLLPYLLTYKWRVAAALLFMVGAKLANVSVPLLLKDLVDAMSFKPNDPVQILVVPVALLVGYGALRLMTSAFTELRELVFAKATQGAARTIALETFQHLHALSLRFHLARQTGGMTRDIERGVRGIESLISYSLYSIVPTLIEVTLVLTLLAVGSMRNVTLETRITANRAQSVQLVNVAEAGLREAEFRFYGPGNLADKLNANPANCNTNNTLKTNGLNKPCLLEILGDKLQAFVEEPQEINDSFLDANSNGGLAWMPYRGTDPANTTAPSGSHSAQVMFMVCSLCD